MAEGRRLRSWPNRRRLRHSLFCRFSCETADSNMPAEPLSERTPIFRDIHVSGLTARDVKTPIFIRGLDEAPISDVSLRDINIQSREKPQFLNYKNLSLTDVTINGKTITLE